MATQTVESKVKAFYEEHPYPNWKNKLDAARIRGRLDLLKGLNVPLQAFENAMVLDAGCGTGEKTLMMSRLGCRKVIGIDLSQSSLDNAANWARENGIDNVEFQRANLLDLKQFATASFDIVHSAGVLHHTQDPVGGFRELTRVLKPGGTLIIYVYNPMGRAYIRLKRGILAMLGKTKKSAQDRPTNRRLDLWHEDNRDSVAAFNDFFHHPHESFHYLGEIFNWFESSGLTVSGIYPRLSIRKNPAGKSTQDSGKEFRKPGRLKRWLFQWGILFYVLIRRTHYGWAVAGIKKGRK